MESSENDFVNNAKKGYFDTFKRYIELSEEMIAETIKSTALSKIFSGVGKLTIEERKVIEDMKEKGKL